MANAPTIAIGYVSQSYGTSTNAWWMYDGESTPELRWPQSVTVYDAMRTQDAQVGSVLEAVMRPVLRTPWRIDPAGARDEVVEFVADDLGLPIVGANPDPPPRTKDRFSWLEHLELALLMLPFGHIYFEQIYRVTDGGGRAHLGKLEPRMPKTIDKIDVARDGGLVSITQCGTLDYGLQRPIPVDRLVAYIYKKEGGNWLGRSILRQAYKNWLIKDRLLRVQVQTIERNGMGIPTYTDAEGASADQHAAGLAMAQALRSGEAAGIALPFGAGMTLMGVSGTLPDAQPAIDYHDNQIARAVLAHFLNLGQQTGTGSYALGVTFADFFTLSLQTLAQQIADVATQHIVEDLVDINWGPEEPAPKVTFDEIGSRQAATAQSITTLIQAGALTPDARLEESLRQQYGLPPAEPADTGTAEPPPVEEPGPGEPVPVLAGGVGPKGVDGDDFEVEVAALVAALADFCGEVYAKAGPDFDAKHPRGAGGLFRTVFGRIQRALADWENGDGPSNVNPFEGLGFKREHLRDAARRRGITLRRGATESDIVEALKDDVRGKRAGTKAAKSPDVGKPVRFTLTGGTTSDQKGTSLNRLRNEAGLGIAPTRASAQAFDAAGVRWQLGHSPALIAADLRARGAELGGSDRDYLRSVADAIDARVKSTKLRNLDVGVFTENGKVALWEVSDSGQKRRRVALVDDLAGLAAWADEHGESELAGWARKERGGAEAPKGPATKSVAPPPGRRALNRAEAAKRRSQLDGWGPEHLRDLLAERGLDTSGLKKDLINRLVAHETVEDVPSMEETVAAFVAEHGHHPADISHQVFRPGFGERLDAADGFNPAAFRPGQWREVATKGDGIRTRTYENGPHQIVILGDIDVTPAQLAEVKSSLDDIVPRLPLLRPYKVVIEDRGGLESQHFPGQLRIASRALTHPTAGEVGHHMPQVAGGSYVRYQIAHELGHGMDYRSGHPGGREDGLRKRYDSSLSSYGKGDDGEAYAEAFAEWLLSDGRTSNPAAKAYAKKYGWAVVTDRSGPSPAKTATPTPAKKATKAAPTAVPDAVAKIRGLGDGATEDAVFRELNVDGLTSAKLREVADGLGIEVPPNMLAKSSLQMHIAEAVAGGNLGQPKKAPDLDSLRTLDTEARRDALDLRKVDELKAMLREANLPVSGKKRDLVDRLVSHLDGPKAEATPAPKAAVPGSAPAAPSARPARAVGRNIASETDYESLPLEYNLATHHDDALEEIVKRQGFDGRPQVVSRAEFDAAVKRGEVRETWRGVGRHETELTPDQLAEAYRTGDFYVGLGINGNGTYVAMRRADGEYYSSFGSGNGPTLLRIGLRNDARVISADDLDREMDEFFGAAHRTEKHRSLQRDMLARLAKAKSARARANIRREYYRTEFYGPDRRSRLLAIQRDPGRFAALRGYDAIDISKDRSPDKHAEMIILNRTATIVQAAE